MLPEHPAREEDRQRGLTADPRIWARYTKQALAWAEEIGSPPHVGTFGARRRGAVPDRITPTHAGRTDRSTQPALGSQRFTSPRAGRTDDLAGLVGVIRRFTPPPARGGRKTASGVGLWSSAHPRAGRTVLVKFGEPLFDGFTLAREEDRVLAE